MPTQRTSYSLAFLPPLACATLLATGCSGFQSKSVEERVNALLKESDQRIAASQTASTRTNPQNYPTVLDPAPLPSSALDLNPPTVNIPVTVLNFNPADEKRDVAERLRRYAEIEGMIISQTLDSSTPPPPPSATPNARLITLSDAFSISQRSGRELLNREDEYVLASIRLLIERHLWGPRFFNDTTVGLAGQGTDGNFNHTMTLINELKATKRLPYGGQVEAAWVISATDQLREVATNGYRQSSALILSGTVPLLRGAGNVAREDLIQAERELVYQARAFERFRREYLVSLAADYFSLIQTRASIENQQKQLYSLQNFEQQTRARAEAGKIEAVEVGIASNRVQTAISSLSSLVDRYIFQLERFKIRLGLPINDPITISDDIIDLPDPEVDMVQAANLALDYRLDLQNQRDRLDDTRRQVANAKNNLLPDLRLGGSVGIPTPGDDPTGGLAITGDDLNYAATATLSLPLDRETERLNLRATMITLQRAARQYEQDRDNVVVDVRDSLRAVDNSRIQLTIAEKQVEINRERLRGLKIREDTIDAQVKIDAENDLLDSENERDRATAALRNAVLNYLLATDQLRVARDGTFQPLPGMNTAIPPVAEPDAAAIPAN